MKLSSFFFSLPVVISLVSFITLSSCKTSSRGINSEVSSLTINTPSALNGIAKSVRVVATPNQVGSDCPFVTYLPSGDNSFDDEGNFMSLDGVEAKIALKFLNMCFPYEVSIMYMCPTKEEGATGNVQCYKGTATAEIVPGQTKINLPIPLEGMNGYEKTPVENDKMVSDFIGKECSINIATAIKQVDGSSSLLLQKECKFGSNAEREGFKLYSKIESVQEASEVYSSNIYTISESGYQSIIMSINVDSKDIDLQNIDKEDILATPVKENITIKYCSIKQDYIMGYAGCSEFGTLTWTKN